MITVHLKALTSHSIVSTNSFFSDAFLRAAAPSLKWPCLPRQEKRYGTKHSLDIVCQTSDFITSW